MTHTTQNEECKHNWKLNQTRKEYFSSYNTKGTPPIEEREYAYWACSKCLSVKKVKVHHEKQTG